ncbi:hypothetical protein [Streptomyces sp. NPDC101166]|uniref:hypothetical protein n=1 Tax=Streptomyces sp. NPDC101166 TaxID=3366120 RepID=UPI003815ACBE
MSAGGEVPTLVSGVLSYRITRGEPDGNRVYVELDFGSREHARSFAAVLEGIWRTPRSAGVLVNHGAPEIRDLVERQTLQPNAGLSTF